jgi:hypothetical protein
MRRTAKLLGWLVAVLLALPLLVLAGGNTNVGRHMIERLVPVFTGDTVRIDGVAGLRCVPVAE